MTDAALVIEDLSAGYGDGVVLRDLSLSIPKGQITAIIGANASGKSTLLRAMSRLLAPRTGRVLLDGHAVHSMAPRRVARRIGLLPQTPVAPEGITVLDLVSRGRHPHQGAFGRWRREDEEAVADALSITATSDLADRFVEDLSGGQRQRVWVAMALAQRTDILLLDEPTTFLDINHQVEVLDLLADLKDARGTTIVMVLHDLNLAARYGDLLIAMVTGRIARRGPPRDVLDEEMLEQVFRLRARVMADPVTGKPMMIPLGRHSQGHAIP